MTLTHGIKWSVIFHLLILVFLVSKGILLPEKRIQYIPTLRVDIVGLPEILKKDLPGMSDDVSKGKEADKSEMDTPSDDLSPKGKKAVRQKKMNTALAKIKALQKISQSLKNKPPALIKGNIVSDGTSLSGEARESAEPNYFDKVLEQVKMNWTLPVWLARQNLSAQILIFIDSNGRIQGMKYVKKSGNQQFDDEVDRTLNSSQPFPPPPAQIAGSTLRNGILLGFPL